MKEIRGPEAVRYAGEMGINFNIDKKYLAERESLIRGKRASPVHVYMLLGEKLGREFKLAEVIPGSEVFDLLIKRYAENWAYVALEGDSPETEERVTLRLLRRMLEGQIPAAGADVRELFRRFGQPRLGRTGFPSQADLNLVFHAALRLVGKSVLKVVEDPGPARDGRRLNYGRRRFILPPDTGVSLVGVLCEECRVKHDTTILSLHRECATRLRRSLGRLGARSK